MVRKSGILVATIANLTDQVPLPIATNSLGPNTDASLYDVFGRIYSLALGF